MGLQSSTSLHTDNTMKLIIFTCFICVASAAPQNQDQIAAITRDDRIDNGDGTFSYAFETENGIAAQAASVIGSQGQANIEGFYSFPLADGSFAEVRYVA